MKFFSTNEHFPCLNQISIPNVKNTRKIFNIHFLPIFGKAANVADIMNMSLTL